LSGKKAEESTLDDFLWVLCGLCERKIIKVLSGVVIDFMGDMKYRDRVNQRRTFDGFGG
jgi:hypothetical protein